MAYVSNKRLADSIFKSVRLLLRWSGQQSFSKSLGPRTLGTKSAKHPTYNKSCIVFAGLYVIFKSNIISVMQLLSLGQVRSGQVRSGQVRSGQVRSGQVRSGQVRSGQVRSGQDRTGQDRTGQEDNATR